VPDDEFTVGVTSSAPVDDGGLDGAFALADVDPLFLVWAEAVDDDLAGGEDAEDDAEEETEEDAEDEAVDAATWVGGELVQVGFAVAPAPL
jgi:hypothetical protein